MSRSIVVVDCETTGLNPFRHVALTCAWWNLTTGEHASFVCPRSPVDMESADEEALLINRFHELIEPLPQDDGYEVSRLHDQLVGATLAGSSPAFDTAFLTRLLADEAPRPVVLGDIQPWHHRLLDLSNVAAAVLGLPFNELPGLAKVCDLLGVAPPDHTAAGDVRSTGECLRLLMAKTGATA